MWMTTLYETSKLTVELCDIVDNGDNSVDIWAFDYPSFYKGDDKKAFEKKVIDHYYFRQIGSETVGRFLHQFRTKVREVMPYYIQLYESQALMQSIEDPFGNVDIVETFEQESSDTSSGTSSFHNLSNTSGTTSGTASGSSTSKTSGTESAESETTTTSTSNETTNNTVTEDKEHRFSNTPQGSIDNLDKYMTEASVDDNSTTTSGTVGTTGNGTNNTTTSGMNSNNVSDTSEATTSGTSEEDVTASGESDSSTTSSGTVKHTFTKKGNQGVNTYAHDMKELRETFLNIDMMIINELNCLFLGVY